MDDGVVSIIDLLDADQRAELEALGSRVVLPAGHTIFFQGHRSASALLLQEGLFKVTTPDPTDPNGPPSLLAIRGPVELVGDEGVLLQQPRSATITTITEVAGLEIDGNALLEFVDTQRLWPVMYRAVVLRRRQSDQNLLLAQHDVKTRLAWWLLELGTLIGRPDTAGLVIESTLSQRDLASRISASREAVAVELRRLRNEHVVSTARNRIVLLDLPKLRERAAPYRNDRTDR